MNTILFSTILFFSLKPSVTNVPASCMPLTAVTISIDWPDNVTVIVNDPSQTLWQIHPDNLVYPYNKPVVTGCDDYYTAIVDEDTFEFGLCKKILRTWEVECGSLTFNHVQIIKVISTANPILPCNAP